MTQPEDLRSFLQRYGATAGAHRFDELASFYAPSILFNDVRQDSAAVIEDLTNLTTAFPDWRWEPRHALFEGDLVMMHLVDTGTHLGPYQGVEPTGRKVTVTEFTVYRVVDGKIAEMWVTLDTASLMRQIS